MSRAIRVHILATLLAGLACVSASVAAETDWPFTPLAKSAAPEVADASWVANDIDAFILAKLEAEGLRPAPQIDKRRLAKRLYLDLIGLPPSPTEMESFLADDRANAYEVLVDKLLADPRFGEHWARYWLDLARYADTAGYEGDPDLPHAWRYRDYVIDSFNRDKPYDQFIREQLAGDELQDIIGAGELPIPPSENLVALTFLRLAPFTEPRGDESRHEMLSEMTTTVSSVFLGLTVGCAKCHDHKYDPIPTEDFYRMKSFFATIQIPPPLRGDGFQIGGPTAAPFYRKGEAEWAKQKEQQLRNEAGSAAAERARLANALIERLGIQPGFGFQTLGGGFGNDYVYDQRRVTDDKPHTTIVNSDGKRWTYYTDRMPSERQGSLAGSNRGQWYAGIQNPTFVSLGAATNGTGKPQAAYFNGRLAHVLVFDRPLTPDEVNLDIERLVKRDGLQLWLDASDLDADPATPNPPPGSAVASWKDKINGTRLEQSDSEMQPVVSTLDQNETAAVHFDDDFLIGPPTQLLFLKNKQGSVVTVFRSNDDDESYIFEVGGGGQHVTTFVNPTAAGGGSLDELIARGDEAIKPDERERYLSLSTKEKYLPQQVKRLQPLAMTLRHSIGPPYEPGVPTSRVMIRGEWNNPGEVVEPGFLSCVTGNDQPAAIRLDTFKRWPTRSRRKALADWIASADNPLTARVIVNRLWYRHFGRGIVETPSDFGSLSGGPSHENLLDFLATKLTEGGWKLKTIHRLICLSSTYQQDSQSPSSDAAARDPENTLYWRFPLRRLSAEVVRDRVLSVSGRLNPEHFGLPIFPPLPDGIEQRVKYNDSKWATQYGPEGRKRSIYIYQQRTLNMPLLQTFDGPVCDESRPRRRTSTTPLQALAMYNGPLVTAEAPHFANRVMALTDDPGGRIQAAFRIALCREPQDDELRRLTAYYGEFDSPQEAMISICRILYNSNEFLYLD